MHDREQGFRTDADVPKPARCVPSADTPPRQPRILVVEDSGVIRRIVVRLLLNAGFEVLEAGSGSDALRLLDALARPIDLLITDLWLPGMNGRQVVAEVRRRQPDVRVLYVSGDPGEVIDEPFLAKPFMPGHLLGLVNEILAMPTLRGREGSP